MYHTTCHCTQEPVMPYLRALQALTRLSDPSSLPMASRLRLAMDRILTMVSQPGAWPSGSDPHLARGRSQV